MHLKPILISLFGLILSVLSLMISAEDVNPIIILFFFIGFMLIFAGPFYFYYLEPILVLQKSEK